MRIALCGSLAFTYEFAEIKKQLEAKGFEVEIPFTSREILAGNTTLESVEASKGGSESPQLKSKIDVIRRYHDLIQTCDAILVVNLEKKGIKGYIGGNSFLEMGFAHIMRKPIFLLHPIPDVSFKDEMAAMNPMILHGDLAKLESAAVAAV